MLQFGGACGLGVGAFDQEKSEISAQEISKNLSGNLKI
jgi:hypothetical protein